jgi:hypothetical protein
MIPLPPDPARGEDILTWARAIQSCLRRLRLQSGPGIRISEGANSTTISANPASSSSSTPAAASHPFQVLMRSVGTPESPAWQAGVVRASSLFKSLRPNDKQAINGLLDEDPFAANAQGWFDMIPNDAIWLGITFDSSGSVTYAGIDSWGQSDSFQITKEAWSGEDGYCEDDGSTTNPVHQTSRKLIAYSVAGNNGEPVLTQCMTRDQLLRNVCIDGRPARYPFDHEGGYPL